MKKKKIEDEEKKWALRHWPKLKQLKEIRILAEPAMREEEEMKKGGHMADQLAAVGKFIGKAISWIHVCLSKLIFILSTQLIYQ